MEAVFLRVIRRFLRQLDTLIAGRAYPLATGAAPSDYVALERYKAFLLGLPGLEPAAKDYVRLHLHRLARTLTLVPPPIGTSRALELGCYLQMTPALKFDLGYQEIRGAYYGSSGCESVKPVCTQNGPFSCRIDVFDAERDRFPYPDNQFDLVLACEVIEHLASDPMHMVVEAHRVLVHNG